MKWSGVFLQVIFFFFFTFTDYQEEIYSEELLLQTSLADEIEFAKQIIHHSLEGRCLRRSINIYK